MIRTTFIFTIATSICLAALGQTKKDSLHVFVGKKIEVIGFEKPLEFGQIRFDSGFKAKYEIIQQLHGKYMKDTIEFEAYDHYGTPAFSKYDYVLLFVSYHNGKLYHEKYQYFDVYKSKNGRWASGYKAGDYMLADKKVSVKPEVIDFQNEVSYDLRGRNQEKIEEMYPAPYYKVENGKAIVLLGNYVEQLFELKKMGALKGRGIF